MKSCGKWKGLRSPHPQRENNGGEVGVATEIALFDDGRGFVVLQNGEGRWDSLYKIEEAVLGL